MLFIATLTLKESAPPGAVQEALKRHQEWQHPPGLNIIADYYVSGTPQIVIICEAQDTAPLYALHLAWGDLFEVKVYPAMPLDEAIRTGLQMYQSQSGQGGP